MSSNSRFVEARDDTDNSDDIQMPSDHHHQQTQMLLATGQTPFLPLNLECQSVENISKTNSRTKKFADQPCSTL